MNSDLPDSAHQPAPATAPAQNSLVFDDPLDQPSDDDADSGWGERPSAADGAHADLSRFLDEKPPHHL